MFDTDAITGQDILAHRESLPGHDTPGWQGIRGKVGGNRRVMIGAE